MERRHFITISTLGAAAALAAEGPKLGTWKTLGALREEDGTAPIEGAHWFVAEASGDGMAYEFPAGTLGKAKQITADFLLDGAQMAVFRVTLKEGANGREFRLSFAALNQCSARMRVDLGLVDQNKWMADREGAFLKPLVSGERVDLDKVDRMSFTVWRKSAKPVRWCMTELRTSTTAVPKLTDPVLPKGPLLDELGQSRLHEWPAKTRSVAELKARISGQDASAGQTTWPESFSRWGGWKAKKLGEASGFFRTAKADGRWWLVDPDGYAFWSAGADCVRVDGDARIDGIESALAWMPDAREYPGAVRRTDSDGSRGRYANFLAANMMRSLGSNGWREKWARIALSEMKKLRFNTVGNWSEWEYAAKAQFPYVRPMSFRGARCGVIYRDFPDVFHAGFELDATDYASQLKTTAADPAFIGYFLMNEPTWGFSSELPAAGMLYTTDACATREELAKFLRGKYEGDAALEKAWGMAATLDRVARGRWKGALSKPALADLREFSVRMVERYFVTLSKACKAADPKHLNLGMRWAGVPPEWAVQGMKSFDVYSLNCYQEKMPLADAARIDELLNMPVMVGEWHFGALDVGLPSPGLGHLKNQADRARAYRVYLEDAAADPHCVGVHWFTLYDQSALGRFDGENYNIGFLDICNRPYEEMGRAAIASHERMYGVAQGTEKAYSDAPEYLPKLFL